MGKQWYLSGNVYQRGDGWTVGNTMSGGVRRWYVESPERNRTMFDTDGGLYLAIDMADAYIEGIPLDRG